MGHSEDKRQLWRDAVLIVIACIMYSVSADIITPIHVIPGSVLGIAQLFYAVKGWPVGVVNLVINIPIMVICVSRFGRKVLIYTIAVVCGNSLFMDVLMPFMPEVSGFLWKIVLCIIAGAANGSACGLVMRIGGSVGGTTAVVRVLKSYFQGMNVTAVMFLSDLVIMVIGAVLLSQVSLLFYSIIFSLSASAAVDFGYTFGRKNVDKVD